MNEFNRALRVIPGGVNSPVRAFGAVGGVPPFIARGQGAYLQDTNGKLYVDYVLSWGALIAGHAHPQILEAVRTAAAQGLSFGAPTEAETTLAETLCECLPSLEQVRLVSSGTEAAMSAVRLARGCTGRALLLKFEGHYHGHADSLLVKAGSGALTFGHPSSKGVPEAIAGLTLVAPFNDVATLENIFAAHGSQLAAVILEPVPGNMNLIRPQQQFLLRVRQLCTQHQTILIFDEVMCGFRVGLQGAQGLFNIRPDLTVLGKVIGGGLPLAAFGGRRDILEQLAPTGPVYQAGTLSGNPVAVAAGLAALSLVRAPGYYEKLQSHGNSLCQRLQRAAAAVGFGEFSTQSIGSMFGFYFRKQVPENYREATDCNIELFKKFFHGMLQRGIYLAPSAFEAGFLSSAHGEEELQRTEVAARATFAQLAGNASIHLDT